MVDRGKELAEAIYCIEFVFQTHLQLSKLLNNLINYSYRSERKRGKE